LSLLTAAGDKKVPNELLERAEAIAVIPNMIKGAFGIGGRYGKGLVSQRAANGKWSLAHQPSSKLEAEAQCSILCKRSAVAAPGQIVPDQALTTVPQNSQKLA
jgi:hypothetical protein